MTSQESDEGDTRFDLRAQQSSPRKGREADDLGVSASNRAVAVTLALGIGLMVLILLLPYISR
ncbi:hypothetical protein [Nesterenkonia flava]|uniref:Uncharacterized protein n=1 Tax=Nesterenkonia flava TaxID=469799 RepID=A0ABU1FSY6_9MICC|nr:hypothetical protein [Nesterenkonia flava]MDR5711765.1 hypothetical protein [Nesterenkonia flava]